MEPAVTDVPNTIEKHIELHAPVERVWRALTDPKEFGEWFRVNIETPFVVGQEAYGQMTHPGYEHFTWRATIQRIEPMHRFAFTWHPYGIDKSVDYSAETPTLVEFLLEEIPGGTSLTVRESGFDKVPAHRRELAFRMNDRGWTGQIKNIERHVSGANVGG